MAYVSTAKASPTPLPVLACESLYPNMWHQILNLFFPTISVVPMAFLYNFFLIGPFFLTGCPDQYEMMTIDHPYENGRYSNKMLSYEICFTTTFYKVHTFGWCSSLWCEKAFEKPSELFADVYIRALFIHSTMECRYYAASKPLLYQTILYLTHRQNIPLAAFHLRQ